MFDVERIRFPDEIAQFAEPKGPRVEIGSQIGKLSADRTEGTHPSSLSIWAITFRIIGTAADGGCKDFIDTASGSLAGAEDNRFSV